MEIFEADKQNISDLEKIQEECLEKLEHQDFSYILSSKSYVVFAIKNNQSIVGFISASISYEQADILQVCVIESERNKGLGFLLVNKLSEYLKEKGVEKIFLEVNENNAPAISLYTKSGFEKISERKNYYGKNSAIIMQKTL